MKTYWSAPKFQYLYTTVILGCGPSMQQIDLNLLRRVQAESGCQVISINDNFLLYPQADLFYFCDAHWYEARKSEIGKLKHDLWVTLDNEIPGVRTLRNTGLYGLETDPTGLRNGNNGGYQCINLAYHFGAKRIILLGMDMKVAANGMTHWNHRPLNISIAPSIFQRTINDLMLPHFQTLKAPLEQAGVEVINCTPDSALDVWPKVPLEQVLAESELLCLSTRS